MPDVIGKSVVVRAIQALIAGCLRLLFLTVLIPCALLLQLWECLIRLFRSGTLFPDTGRERCPPLPESLVRRPDPCIYSQTLLAAQGLPFTYKNPDIWIVHSDNPAIRNPPLTPSTEYIVNVRIHNASIDPAIGVRVGLATVGAVLNATGHEPAERDSGGRERFRFAHIPGMASTVVRFSWVSPPLPLPEPGNTTVLLSGLQVRLFHPLDTNLTNNVGHHNYSVSISNLAQVHPGQQLNFTVPLNNPGSHPARFRFEANLYDIAPDETFKLRLRRSRGEARWSPARRLYNHRPTLHGRIPSPVQRRERGPGVGRFDFQGRSQLQLVRARYEGFEQVRQSLLSRDWSLPSGMEATTLGHGDGPIELVPGETRPISFRVVVPRDAEFGSQISINLVCRAERGELVAGFTMVLNVGKAEE